MNIILYPDGHINERVMELLVLYINQVSLCLPGKIEIDPWVAPYLDKKIIKLITTKRPCPDNIDKALSEYTRWAEEYFGRSGGWKDVKNVRLAGDEETRSNIEKSLRESMNDTREGQITAKDWASHTLMHMAKRRDMEQREAREYLLKAESAGKSLADIMGVDAALWETAPGAAPQPSGMDDFLIAQRLRAWAYLFKDQIPMDGALLTGNVAAHDFMEEICGKLSARFGEKGSKSLDAAGFLLDPIRLRMFELSDPAQTLEMREGPVSAIRAKIHEVLKAVSDKDFSASEMENLNTTIEALNGEIAELGSDEPFARLIIYKAPYVLLEDALDELAEGAAGSESATRKSGHEVVSILIDTGFSMA